MKRPDLVVAGGTAVVTGAAGGMGEHIATGLARRGADLVVLDRDADGLDRVVAEIGRETPGARVTPLVVDLADPDCVTPTSAGELGMEFPLVAKAAIGADYDRISFPGKRKIWFIDDAAELRESRPTSGA
mgnify:CR=1 FL=1